MKTHFERFLAYRRAAIKPSTAATYRTDQAAFFRWADTRGLTMARVQRVDIAEWMAHAQTLGHSNGVIVARLAILRAFFTWAEDAGLRRGNPVELKKLPRLKSAEATRRPFTETEFRAVLQAAEAGRPFWPAAIRIAWSTGFRMSDAAGLLWGEIDLPARVITRRAIKTSVTHAAKTIPIDAGLLETLLTLYNAPDRAASLFVLPAMQSLYQQARTTLCGEFKAICRRAGVANGHYHALRHSFCSRLINSGASTVLVASLTGHRSLKQLAAYSHVSLDAKREALAKAGQSADHTLSLYQPKQQSN